VFSRVDTLGMWMCNSGVPPAPVFPGVSILAKGFFFSARSRGEDSYLGMDSLVAAPRRRALLHRQAPKGLLRRCDPLPFTSCPRFDSLSELSPKRCKNHRCHQLYRKYLCRTIGRFEGPGVINKRTLRRGGGPGPGGMWPRITYRIIHLRSSAPHTTSAYVA
jgi:hypothetical protein